MESVPILAEVMLFSGNFAPRGWADCDGSLLKIEPYQALYSLVGTTYGGDGKATFGLPKIDPPVRGLRYVIAVLGEYPQRH